MRNSAIAAATLLVAWSAAIGDVAAPQPEREAQWARGLEALRAMNCARCHGRDFDGWAAPSLIAAVRDGPRERFDRWVLDGGITRGEVRLAGGAAPVR